MHIGGNDMAFPTKNEIKTVLKKLKKVEGTLMLPDDATPLEKFRFELCQRFIKYKLDNNLTQAEFAKILGIDGPKMSKILHHRIDEFSTDRLINLYSCINPNLKLKVA